MKESMNTETNTIPNADPITDVWKYLASPLEKIFNPKSVAIIGATEKEGSVGKTVFCNLINSNYKGKIYPINSNRENVFGHKAYSNISLVDDEIDLVVIVTPATIVPKVLQESADKKIPAAVIISAGFKELGDPGIELENQIQEIIKKSGMRVVGPNCLGVMNPLIGFNATFACDIANPGSVAFISQSGALCTAVLDWSFKEKVGFSAFVSIGSMLDVNWGDLIDYFGSDQNTKSIIIYMESIGNARAFLSAAREVSLTKPIILIKAGRTDAAAKAAASHTGSLTGSDDVLDEAFKRVGVLRVNEISELFDMSEVLAKQPLPKGPRLTILTNAGGPGVLATDALILAKGKLTELSNETFQELNKILPPHWSRSNPIDILGDADAERYSKSLEIAANDPNSDGLLVILTPQDMTDPEKTAEFLKRYAQIPNKPLIASWMGGPMVSKGNEILNDAGIPTFSYPDRAVKAFVNMWKYQDNLSHLYEVPNYKKTQEKLNNKLLAKEIINKAIEEKREILTESESKEILSSYNIPVVENYIASDEKEAVNYANKISYPVVLKLHSLTLTHKTDVGGVKLNLNNDQEVREAFQQIKESVARISGVEHFNGVAVQKMINLKGYELILGSSLDQQIGPVILFGLGGQLVEVFKDSAIGVPPLNNVLARKLMEKTKIYKALQGVRGNKAVDLDGLESLLVNFSQMIIELNEVIECDINPLLVSSDGLLALDARFVINYKSNSNIRPAIRPYPSEYRSKFLTKDQEEIILRPILPEDYEAIQDFHKNLSNETVRSRYNRNLNLEYRISYDRLRRICFTDYDREISWLRLIVTMRL